MSTGRRRRIVRESPRSGEAVNGRRRGRPATMLGAHRHERNAAERGLHGLVLGRKNHYGSKSRRGTEVAAVFCTLSNAVPPRVPAASLVLRRVQSMSAETKGERVTRILQEATNAVAPGGAAALVAVASAATPAAIVASAMVGALPQSLVSIIGIARRWKEGDAAKWWHQVLYSPLPDGVTPEEIAGRIDARQDEPCVRETILRSIRTLLDCVDSCVVTPLALLAREYLREGQIPDDFFRGVSRVLSDVSAAEFADLQVLCSCMAEQPGEWVGIRSGTPDIVPHGARLEWEHPTSGRPALETTIVDVRHTPRLLRLLVRNDLGVDVGVVGGGVHGECIRVHVSTATRLRRIVGVVK
jgi:hypothetical protein